MFSAGSTARVLGGTTVGKTGSTLFALLLVAGVMTVGAPSPASAAEGVTADSVKIGFVFSQTGVASATSGDSDVGCKARVGRENAQGGVNGRKLDVVYSDDKSSANLVTTQDLVQNQHAYMIINDSAFLFTSYRWLLDNNVPTIGGGFDGQEYGVPGNEKLISGLGLYVPISTIQTTVMPKIMKSLGATKVAGLGYGISPSSANAVKSFMTNGVPKAGLEAAYTNTSVDFGTTDVGPLVLGIKNAGADAAFYAMNANTNLAIAAGLVQNNVQMKVQMMATGYGQNLLDQPIAQTMSPNILMTQGWAPVEVQSKATKQLQSDLKKYADYTGVPDFGIYTGYVDCDLAILGLEQQGQNLDPNTFADSLRKVGKYNLGGGLSCTDSDMSLASYGKVHLDAPQCGYAVRVKDGKFQVVKPPGGKTPYWTGKILPSSVPPELIAPSTTAAR
jgi:branched-chain amino acid transport system substrate-binding protein